MDCEVTGVVGIYSNPGHVAAYDDGEVRQQFSICFTTKLLGGTPTPSNESSEVKFVAAGDIPALTMHESIRLRVNHYLEGRKTPYIG